MQKETFDIPDIPISKMIATATDQDIQATFPIETNRENNTIHSCRLISLKCFLTIISLLCLLALLIFNILEQLVNMNEFWIFMDKLQTCSYFEVNKTLISRRN